MFRANQAMQQYENKLTRYNPLGATTKIGVAVAYTTVLQGERRSFTITLGLSEGYGDDSVTHHPTTANKVVGNWMEVRSKEGLLTISGFFMAIELHYTYQEDGNARAKQEPGVRFLGEVSIRRLGAVADDKIVEALNDLADSLGAALGQEHVIVTYRDQTWIRELQAD